MGPSNFALLTTVLLLPLISTIKGFGYEQIKVLFYILSISLIGLLWLLRKPKYKLTPIGKAAGLFMVILWLTSFTGINPKDSILGTYPYFQGAILYSYLFLFFLLVSSSGIKLHAFALVSAGSASLVGLIAIKDWILLNIFNQQIPTYADRVVSTFGQPNFYAGFILLCLPFFHYLLKREIKWWTTMGFLISVTAMILSASKAAFLGAAGLILVWLIWELPFRKLVFGLTLTILIILSITSIKFSAGWVEKELIQPKATTNPDLPTMGVEKRYYIWPILWQLILQKPIIGYGLENIAAEFSRYFEVNKHALFEENLQVKPYLFGLKDLYLDRSHNYLLDLLLFSGILGLLTWLILVLMLLKRILQSQISPENSTLLVGLITYLIWIQFQNQSVVHLVYFWLLVGLIDS